MIYLSQGKGRLRFHPRPEDRGLPAPPLYPHKLNDYDYDYHLE